MRLDPACALRKQQPIFRGASGDIRFSTWAIAVAVISQATAPDARSFWIAASS